jgi:hypothetical protein
VEAAVLVVKLD